jgi:two-component system, OmpR family, phosphate regulon response regulator PhoB
MAINLMPTILIVEDEDSIASIIKYHLKKEGYHVLTVGDGAEAVRVAKASKPDLILLDWILPSIPGVEVCKLLRNSSEVANVPIIMVTAKLDDIDKITGLERGADDYITKPFSYNELLARIKAVLRRLRPAFSGKILAFEDIKIDLATHTVTRGENKLDLSPIEFKILQVLIENPGRVMSRDSLMDKIWGTEIYVGSRTVDVHITRLRKALINSSSDGKDMIKTIRLAGYTIVSAKEVQ